MFERTGFFSHRIFSCFLYPWIRCSAVHTSADSVPLALWHAMRMRLLHAAQLSLGYTQSERKIWTNFGHEFHVTITHRADPFFRSRQLCSYSRRSQHFMEPEGSLPCSQEPSTGSYPEPDLISPYHSIHISKTHFSTVRPATFWSSHWSLSLCLSHQYSLCSPLLPIRATCPVPLILTYRSNYTRLSTYLLKCCKVNGAPYLTIPGMSAKPGTQNYVVSEMHTALVTCESKQFGECNCV
jgi:hypothetical protein